MSRPFRHSKSLLGLLVLFSSLLLSACEQEKAEQIQWQLPLQAPDDPHGSKQVMNVPEWAIARQGEAEIVWLNKNTTKTYSTHLVLGGGSASQNSMDIILLGLASGLRIQNGAFLDDENVDNAAALVEISRNGEVVYRGWLYEKFPELFGMDDPEWKVWLKGITVRPAS